MTQTYRITGLAGRGAISAVGDTEARHEPFLVDLAFGADHEPDLAQVAQAAAEAMASPAQTLRERTDRIAATLTDTFGLASLEITLTQPEIDLGVPVTGVEITLAPDTAAPIASPAAAVEVAAVALGDAAVAAPVLEQAIEPDDVVEPVLELAEDPPAQVEEPAEDPVAEEPLVKDPDIEDPVVEDEPAEYISSAEDHANRTGDFPPAPAFPDLTADEVPTPGAPVVPVAWAPVHSEAEGEAAAAPTPAWAPPSDAPAPEPEPKPAPAQEVAGTQSGPAAAELTPATILMSATSATARQDLSAVVRALRAVPDIDVGDVSPLARVLRGGNEFHTAIATITTTLSPAQLRTGLSKATRVRPGVEAQILTMGDLVGAFDGVEIPLPGAATQAGILVPWAQLDPAAFLGGLGGGPVAALAETAPDSEVVKWLALDWLE